METADRGLAAAAPVAGHMAEVLGWDRAQCEREVDAYRLRVAAERAAEPQPDDRSADAVRRRAPDVRAGTPPARSRPSCS
jgi:glycerol-3-phosphate dehydrogenase